MLINSYIFSSTPTSTLLSGTPFTNTAQNPSWPITNAFDGVLTASPFWASSDFTGAKDIGLDLGTARTITLIRILPRSGFEDRIDNWDIEGGNTSTSSGFTKIGETGTGASSFIFYDFVITDTTPYRYIRFNLTGDLSQSQNATEIEIYGY